MRRHCANRWAPIYFTMVFLGTCAAVNAGTLYSNLSATNGGSDPVSTTSWLACAFTTDSTTYNSLTATLLMDRPGTGSAELDLYSDAGLQPGTLLQAFTSPGSYSTSLS